MTTGEQIYHFTHGLTTMFFFFSSGMILMMSDKTRLQKFLFGVLAFWTLLELKDLFFYPIFGDREGFASQMIILIDNSAVAAGSLYILEITTPKWCNWWRGALFCLPYLLAIILYALLENPLVVYAHFIYLILSCMGLCIYVFYAVRRYNRYLSDNYSNIENINIRWLTVTSIMLTACLAGWILTCFFSSWIADSIFQLTLILLWGVILYFTLRQKEISIIEPEPLSPQETDDNQLRSLIRRGLEKQLLEERLFLNPQLTLADLAAAVGTNRTYLSNYLNHELQTTFYDYINHFRLELAMERLADPENKATLIETAEECGFNSLSTFRRVFQRAHGCSVSEWRRAH